MSLISACLIKSGGIKLAVKGFNLDAVGTPQMTATLKETIQNETGNIITYPPQVSYFYLYLSIITRLAPSNNFTVC